MKYISASKTTNFVKCRRYFPSLGLSFFHRELKSGIYLILLALHLKSIGNKRPSVTDLNEVVKWISVFSHHTAKRTLMRDGNS